MKSLIYIVLCLTVILTASCNNSPKIYSHDEVQIDSANVWTFKKNGKVVNGIVERHTDHFLLNEPSVRHMKVVNGIDTGFKDYIDNECVGHIEYENGEITGTYYGKVGSETYTMVLKDGKAEGLYQVFNSNGKQTYEAIYEDGKLVKSYDFDNNGEKIIPAEDCLELIGYRTGYYESVDYNRNKVLYQPMVIFKFKNITDKPFDEDVKLTCVFTNGGEEWSEDYTWFHDTPYDSPLSPQMSRQCYLQSSVGWTHPSSIYSSNIKCEIQMNGKPYKTLNVANKLLPSNRM